MLSIFSPARWQPGCLFRRNTHVSLCPSFLSSLGLCVSLIFRCTSCLQVLEMNKLVISWFADFFFLHSEGCLFLSLRGSLAVQMLLKVNDVLLYLFFPPTFLSLFFIHLSVEMNLAWLVSKHILLVFFHRNFKLSSLHLHLHAIGSLFGGLVLSSILISVLFSWFKDPPLCCS